MILCLKARESRSPPGLQAYIQVSVTSLQSSETRSSGNRKLINQHTDAGWSSPVARQAHNLKVTGSNPVPATTDNCLTGIDVPETPPEHLLPAWRRAGAGDAIAKIVAISPNRSICRPVGSCGEWGKPHLLDQLPHHCRSCDAADVCPSNAA